MRPFIVAFVVALVALSVVGCSSPCERTARHAMAAGRACREVGDKALEGVCERTYEDIRSALATGKCSTEVTR